MWRTQNWTCKNSLKFITITNLIDCEIHIIANWTFPFDTNILVKLLFGYIRAANVEPVVAVITAYGSKHFAHSQWNFEFIHTLFCFEFCYYGTFRLCRLSSFVINILKIFINYFWNNKIEPKKKINFNKISFHNSISKSVFMK